MEPVWRREINLRINGEIHTIEVTSNELLSDVLRQKMGLTGTKVGCEAGECGACTVILDGQTILSCLTLALECEGKDILTIEGMAGSMGEELHPIQKGFAEHGAVQCGFCTPAMILAAKVLLEKNLQPTDHEIREAINGIICRCTGYMQIIEAILAAAETMRKKR
jgi:aerobic-type carbon monoxide dehydrogenase small subunit (CoxS/CutS family)